MIDMSWTKWQEIQDDEDAEIKEDDSEIVKTCKTSMKYILDTNQSSDYKQGWVEGIDAVGEALAKKEEENDAQSQKLIEELADLEHRQWMHWSKYVAENHDIPEELEDKWRKSWRPYSELSEEQKDKDRKWARKALYIVQERDTDD
jgi:hypothetical protein